MNVKALIHEDESGGFWAEVPAMPGCVTQGETIGELRKNLEEAITGWLMAGDPGDEFAEGTSLLELAV